MYSTECITDASAPLQSSKFNVILFLLPRPPPRLGMHSGFTMRQQAVAAVHSKLLRLNSAAISAISSGHVVNLVSNDVRRQVHAHIHWCPHVTCSPYIAAQAAALTWPNLLVEQAPYIPLHMSISRAPDGPHRCMRLAPPPASTWCSLQVR